MVTMRRAEKEITEQAVIEEVLLENQVGRLGTSRDGIPYVVPMNYAYRDGRILLHSHRDGKKVQDIRLNPRVCFEVDSGEMITGDSPCSYSWRYRSVIATGTARLVEEPEQRLTALRAISDKYAPGKGRQVTLDMVKKMPQLIVIEIKIDEMRGKESSN